jgi:hypothetical protein
MVNFYVMIPTKTVNLEEGMMHILSSAICIMIILQQVSSVAAEQFLVRAGESVGFLKLGDSRERVFELFPKKTGQDEEYSYPDYGCGYEYSEVHWIPPDYQGNGLFIYLKKNLIFEIMVQSKRFPTKEGITQYSSPKQVKLAYPNLVKAFVLLGSASTINGPRDLVYWVDPKSGIAFEFYYDGKQQKRLVSSVIIFTPNTNFQPEGCVGPPRKLKEVAPYTLEPPAEMR